ncbi:MAG: PLP-dependent aminotransferase family protein, partial [Actinomadura rubrobrunea]|nr:PLP-dependent aminotransferase family protein [Actinomadura rubrobrunea]
DLAAALGVSRTTVTAAYDRLRTEGYMESRQGAGSWTALPATTMTGAPARRDGAEDATRFGVAHAPGGPGFIDLGCATPAAPAVFDEAVAAAMAALPRHARGVGYLPAGLPELREAIADGYDARGLPTRPDQIVVTAGAQHALALLAELTVRPGDAVLVERPTYPHALGALRRRGARLVPVGVADGWDVELIAATMRQTAVRAAYTVPEFHNPTGLVMSASDREALVDAARRADAVLIADETFAGLAVDRTAPAPPPLAAFDAGGRVVSVGSASKLLWGGLRIGWIRASAPLARRLAVAREAADIASPVIDQLIVRELLLRAEEVRAERAAALLRSRDALAAALRERLPGWSFTLPEGGMSLWPRLEAPVATQLAETALRHGVRVVPGPAFGEDGVLEDRLRLPYVLPPETLRVAVDRLARAQEEVDAAPAVRSALPSYV